MKVRDGVGTIVLKDSTMREGQDVPGVSLDPDQKRMLLKLLAEARVPEAEIVAPGHFERDLNFAKESGAAECAIRTSGLIYGNRPEWREQIRSAKGVLDRVDILMPLSDARPPADRRAKSRQMRDALRVAIDTLGDVGVGFPHATQVERSFVLEMCGGAASLGVGRITLYDTNGSSDPWTVAELVEGVREVTQVGICFHAHNDLGMATANSIAAVRAGATCLDVTVNGLGDRAGNASLEQVALVLHTMGADHGLRLEMLRELSRTVEAMTRIPVSKLAPVVGEFVFRHKSPGHLASPVVFEAFDPALVGGTRILSGE
jgi:homocitrate synthase NifV